jgi:ubiquinone/menaquinone biosynthesis C-methylase UbiE
MGSTEEKAQSVFGQRASFYTTSASHTDPQVLAKVVAMAAPKPDWAVLDIATGTGHTAFALSPHVRSVIGVDLTKEMLVEAAHLRDRLSLSNVTFRVADVHALPFEDGTFELVTCRRAAHHFSNILLALREMHRVLKPEGKVVIDDRSVPEDDFLDQCMNLLDTYHDESHVREYRASEWRKMLEECGFEVDASESYIKHRPLTSLTDDVSAENVRKIHETLDALTASQKQAFNLVEKDGQLYLNHWFVMISGLRL